MFNPTHHGPSRRRFGLTELMLVAGILVFGAYALLNDGHETFGTLVSGLEKVIGG